LFVHTIIFYTFILKMKKTTTPYCSCLYYSANALSRVMTKMAEEAFSVTGLAPSYAFLLMTINKRPGIQPKEISVQMQLTPSTVTRLVEKMEHKAFLERIATGRKTAIYPTEKSLKLHELLVTAWKVLYERYILFLGEAQAKELTSNIYQAYEKLNS
jgi:MarR family transcriptional regulator, organic hydroperoxide resistance regulator